MDLGEVLLGRSRNERMKAGERARRSGLAIVGFALGCGLGAGCQAVAGLWSLALPASLALVALAMALAAKLDGAQAPPLTPRLVGDTHLQRGDSHHASASWAASNAGRA